MPGISTGKKKPPIVPVIIDGPPPPPPPPPIPINQTSPLATGQMGGQIGLWYCLELLGACNANMDGFYWDVCNAVKANPDSEILKELLATIPRKKPALLDTEKKRLGFVGGVMDAAYNAGRLGEPNGGYNPKPIGKLSDLQQKYEDGEKPSDKPLIPTLQYPLINCYPGSVDQNTTGQDLLKAGGMLGY